MVIGLSPPIHCFILRIYAAVSYFHFQRRHTALHQAAALGHLDVVKYLVSELGAQLLTEDEVNNLTYFFSDFFVYSNHVDKMKVFVFCLKL